MKQLNLPLDWHDDGRGSSSHPILTRSEWLRLGMGSLGTLAAYSYDSPIRRLLERSPQTEFSGPSWRRPSALWLGLPLQHKRRDGSPLYPTSPTILDFRASWGVLCGDMPVLTAGELAHLNSVNGALLEEEFSRALYSGAKPKSNS